MQPITPILLAALQDILSAIVPIIFIVIWVLSQVLGNRNQVAKPPQRAPQQPVQPPKNISDEIESFLKQVANDRGAQPPAEVELLDPDDVELLEPQVKAPRRPAPLRASIEPVALAPVRAELADDSPRPVLASRGKVSAHVEEHIGTSSFAERTSQLGEEVDQIDDDVDERIQKEFDHQVGRLAHLESTPADAAFDRRDAGVWGEAKSDTLVADSLAAVFRDPASIRQAIILNEILRPPTDRW